jgi:hypothetical protein
VPPDRLYQLILDAPPQDREFLVHHVMGREFGIHDTTPGELGRERSNHRFDFG